MLISAAADNDDVDNDTEHGDPRRLMMAMVKVMMVMATIFPLDALADPLGPTNEENARETSALPPGGWA